jgi:lipopolysaccharide/colanic/teichoic acid biosynthesis glycosyltransferase
MRTLYVEHFGIIANEESPKNYRITRIGKFLRSTKLDEIPQLLNVLIGDMSIVGPRPDIAEQTSNYTPLQKQRLLVKPGITGIAQISGNTLLPWPYRIELDIWYIQNWSHIIDFKIILQTFKTIINKENIIQDPFNLHKELRDKITN